ncbi:MAG: site-2 protease family protein [Limisphaerales bacterium]
MDTQHIVNGLITYLELIFLLTFHEFAHAWMAWKRGDDTARLQGRLSLNPVVHIDPIGTVLLPLFQIFGPSSITRYVIGWAKPVPFNPAHLRNRRTDETLIAMAGPAMNLLLAVALMALARVALIFNSGDAFEVFFDTAQLSLLLAFFNLIPIPPLDGSHVMRHAVGMSYETYANLSRFGFIIIIVVINIPIVWTVLNSFINGASSILLFCFRFPT